MNEEIEVLKKQMAELTKTISVMQGRFNAATVTLAVTAACLPKEVAADAAKHLRLQKDQMQGQLLGSQMQDLSIDWLNRELDGYLTQLDGAAALKDSEG
ncbi:MAG: hypothetical protein E2582_17730 [Delftia sp.]|uniref:hypothetical protein n=1 Tax=Delftia sp. ZNC0008 TaxID=1339242 RepID=UPI0006468171|nr:hypothetical protein [Delftia sp. ZNC0008]MPT06037.1 hypothetical protein [Delftia sp.]